MSGKVMGATFDYVLDLGGVEPRTARLVLLALANHADHNGENVWPSVATIAWETDLSPRTVHRVMGRMRARGLIAVTRAAGFHRPKTYRLILSILKKKKPRADAVSPIKGDTSGQKAATTAAMGDATVAPEPSLEPSFEPEHRSRDGTRSLRSIGGLLRCRCGEHALEHRQDGLGACRRPGCGCPAFRAA